MQNAIKLKEVWHIGVPRWYPVCAYSKALAECMDRKSLSKRQINILIRHGFAIDYIKGE